MNVFWPSITIRSPSGVNEVRIPVASEPAVGAVITSEPSPPLTITGSRRFFCSSSPKSMSGFMPWKVVA